MSQNQIVSVSWLKENLDHPNLILLDASIPVVTENLKSKTSQIIKGALFFDLKTTFSNPDAYVPNTFPSSDRFEKGCRALGIDNKSLIIIYDSKGIYSSPRAWYMFKTMGHENVAILNGGLPEWLKHDGSYTNSYATTPSLGNFKANFEYQRLISATEILEQLIDKTYIIIDARSSDRFNGKIAEPRKDLRKGHIPTAVNIPYTSVLRDNKYLPQIELKQLFEKINLSNAPIILSCGSGITACIVLLAIHLISEQKLHLYDGSWTEWGKGEKYPIE